MSFNISRIKRSDAPVTRYTLISWYKGRLDYFMKVGIGRETDFGTVVTPVLLRSTRRRIEELQGKRKRGDLIRIW